VIVPIMTYERSTVVNSEKHIGLDVHQAKISVAVMDSKGTFVMESILETKAATILEFFAGLRGTLLVTFEEGTWAMTRINAASMITRPCIWRLANATCRPSKSSFKQAQILGFGLELTIAKRHMKWQRELGWSG
jgi:hypothetical protein